MSMLKASMIKKQENRKVAKTAQPNLTKQFQKNLSWKEEHRKSSFTSPATGDVDHKFVDETF